MKPCFSKIKWLFILFAVLMPVLSHAQLLPSIGLNNKPLPNTPVCPIPWYLGSFYTSGFAEGSFAPDFKLYSLSGDSLQLSQKLANGKPVLLIAGSLTCPVFMGKISLINQVMATYGSQVEVYVIYTLEAHPTDTSVYFGYVNITNQNQAAGILFPQPTNYAEREKMVDTLAGWASCNAPIFIDGPCNEWWSAFGPAPNNAYLIDTNGQIFAKHGWFHKNNDDIFCDIDSLLGVNSGLCNAGPATGSFQLQVLNQVSNGNAGSILYNFANLINTSNNPVDILIKKVLKNHPLDWQTAFCADVCYAPTDDSILVTVAPQDTLLFSLDFITSINPDSGNVTVGFRNEFDFNNSYQVKLKAYTTPASLGHGHVSPIDYWYPNPTDEFITYNGKAIEGKVRITDMSGRVVQIHAEGNSLNMNRFATGVYLLEFNSEGQQYKQLISKY